MYLYVSNKHVMLYILHNFVTSKLEGSGKQSDIIHVSNAMNHGRTGLMV